MKIFVLVKQVPDTDTKIKLAADGASWDEAGVKFIMNPYDEYAMEEALKTREALPGTEVIAISYGPERAREALRTALALGADRALLAIDPAAGTADSLRTARALQALVAKAGPSGSGTADLILAGKMAIDTGAGAVGPMLAGLLGMPLATGIVSFKLGPDAKTVAAGHESEAGIEVQELTLPALLTAEKGLNNPRYASLKGIMAAKKKTIEEFPADTLGLSGPVAGYALRKMAPPAPRPAGRRIEGEFPATVGNLVTALRNEAHAI